ncbi:hypothetical protein ACQFX9_08770 [Aliinostoc sp. HNIBRCY26]|uniref:hypothetical protein n=1 Tax=Aliinostoc sp. HNIBRCY26 TaxID=3418997 RepID=UPI003CFE02EB
MLRVYHLLIAIILLIFIPIGARFVLPQFTDNKAPTPTPTVKSTSTTPVKPTVKTENIWQKILGKTTVPTGWSVVPCPDKATLLCISDQGKPVGTVEIQLEPVKNNSEFQQHLAAAGIPLGSPTESQNPEYQTKLNTALQAWVADFYTNVAKTRQSVSTYPPQQVKIGKLPGVRYGFVELTSAGGVKEQYISHVTYDGTQLYIISTSFASDTSNFTNLEHFAAFQPYLDAIAENLSLPIQQAPTKP